MTNQERLQANNAKIEAIQQTLANKVATSGEIEIVENGKYDVSKYASANVNVQPNLATKEITANGTYNASDEGVDGYSSVDVNVPTPDLSQTTATESDVREGKEFFNASGEKVTGTYKDMLQARVDATNSCAYLCYQYLGDNVDFLSKLDTSNVTNMAHLFSGCSNLNSADLSGWNMNSVTTMEGAFRDCKKLSNVNLPDTSSMKSMFRLFYNCSKLSSVVIINTQNVTDMCEMFYDGKFPTGLSLDTRSVTNFARMFYRANTPEEISLDTRSGKTFSDMFAYCSALKTLTMDLRNCSSNSSMLSGCTNLTNLTLKNIKISLQIGSGASWGHLLTLDSLLNTIKELWTNTSTKTLTLTMGTANTAKLADVYVKLIDITDEMRAEDEYIDNKAPFVVCESTDEGAMLITEYITTQKNWQLA